VRTARHQERSGGRRGQAVLEFALILPVFILLVFGAIEFGRAYFVLHLVTNAAREGAREASLPNKTTADVQAVVDTFVTNVGLDATALQTSVGVIPSGSTTVDTGLALADATSSDRVRVVVSYDFDVTTGSIIPGFSGTVVLNGRCVFRHE